MKKKFLLGLLLTCMLSVSACSSEEMFPLPDTEDVGEFFDKDSEGEDKDVSDKDVKEEATATPTTKPTEAPTAEPTTAPTEAPTAAPTEVPTAAPTSEPAADPSAAPTVQAPSELSDDLYSFQVSIDGTIYQFPMWYSDFAALGWTYKGDAEAKSLDSYQYTVAETWVKDNFSVYTEFANMTINPAPFSQCIVAGITLEEFNLKDCGWEIILPKGIQYGVSTKDDIIAAYGTPSYEYDGSMFYKMTYTYDTHNEISLYVYKESGTLDEIEIENIVELEGGNNSVDATVPEIVTNYKAPDAVGEDLYQFNFELEGNLYTLPCPVSELLANGFTINANNSASEIASGSFDWVEFKYNNQTFRAIVHNYADYATIVENCFVTSMETSIYGPDFAMTIPCGIKRGDAEADVLNILKNFNYTTETSSSFTYYTVYNPAGSKLDNFTIVTMDGVVVIIEVENGQKP